MFIAKEIDVREMQPVASEDTLAFQDCREFACSQGVAHSVLRRVVDPDAVRVLPVDGVDRKTVRTMKVWEKRPPEADLVEVMCCEGGCLAGPGVVVNPKLALRLRQGANVAKVGAVPLKR